MPKAIKSALSFQYYSFLLLLVIIPLTITTLTYNRTGLPKSTALQIFGTVYIISAFFVMYLKYFYEKKDDAGSTVEYDRAFDPYMLLFFLAALLSVIFSINPLVSYYGHYERNLGLIEYIYMFLIYYFSIYIFKGERRIRQVLSVIELTALVVSIYACLQYLNLDPFAIQGLHIKRPESTLGNSVFTGGFLALALPFSALNISQKKSSLLKIIFPLIIFSGIVVTETRSAYLAVTAQVLVFIIFYPLISDKTEDNYKKKPRLILVFSGIVIISLVILLVVSPGNPFSQRVLSIFSDGNNPRWILWRDAFNIFKKYPVFGPGIAMFPNAIEEFYSYQLRTADVKRYFDNAHNNFLQVLFTMGMIGLVSYVLIILQGFRSCIRMILNKGAEKKSKIIYLSFFLMLTGYSVYGLTNFDDITILFYFFAFISLLRAFYNQETISKLIIKRGYAVIALGLPVLLTVFLSYNAYNSVNMLQADGYFLKGTALFSSQKFTEGINRMNKAISLNPSCAVYRFILAADIYKMTSSISRIRPDIKNNFLKQAADETEIARWDYFNKNECDALLSLIYYEMGKTSEADSIKKSVLLKDSVNINYRLNLALYYLKTNNLDGVKEQLDAVWKHDYNNINSWSIAAYYYLRMYDRETVKMYCRKILDADPENPVAKELLKKVN